MNKIYIATVFLPLESLKSAAEEVLKEMNIKGFMPVYYSEEEAEALIKEMKMGIVIKMAGEPNGNTELS